MFKGTYTQASIQAMVENPVDRTALISKACESFGGKLLNVFMAFGEDDVIVITELPDDVTAAAFSAQIAVAGTASRFQQPSSSRWAIGWRPAKKQRPPPADMPHRPDGFPGGGNSSAIINLKKPFSSVSL